MSFAVLLAEDDLLINAGLDLLVEVRPREPQYKSVGPFFIDNAELAYDDLVVKGIVEASDMLHVVLVHGEFMDRTVGLHFEFSYPVVDIIIIVRIVLEGFDFVHETAFGRLPETQIRAVRVE